jgi:hypothetical protein
MLLLNQRTNHLQKIGDADADPNYSLSDDSYSDTSDNNSSSFDEINVSALIEPQCIDLTTEKENRKLKSRKRNRAEWNRNKAKLLLKTRHHSEPLKRVLKYLNERYVPLVGLRVD